MRSLAQRSGKPDSAIMIELLPLLLQGAWVTVKVT
ncbi:MAG TPA: ectoine/hydroxyectoine ABC transporter permease subunit EhuC, partial [Pseudomonas sp.]|nr:ectoine/hydroxyectoine ABC transporter permease subunit EhuC [Pseudomonas sp.]